VSKSAVLLVSLALALALGAGYLLRELHAERARVVALQARVAELERAGPAAIPRAEPQTAETGHGVAPEPAVSHDPAQTPSTPGTKRVPSGERESPDAAEVRRQLLDPQIRATELAYARLELEWRNRDLATALNLQPNEAAHLLDLLAKQEIDERLYDMLDSDRVREMLANNGGRLTDEEARTRLEQRAERRRQVEAERAALIGDVKLAEFNEYVKAFPARAEVRELQTMLAETTYPLRSDQVTPMIAALAAELQRHEAERSRLYDGAKNPPTPEETIQYMHERLKLIEQSLQRRHQLATAYLDTEQIKRYDEMLSFERRRAQIDHDGFVAVNRNAPRDGAGR